MLFLYSIIVRRKTLGMSNLYAGIAKINMKNAISAFYYS